MQIKKGLSLLMAFVILTIPMMTKAEKVENEEIQTELTSEVYEVLELNNFEGKLSLSLIKKENVNKEGIADLVTHISEDVLVLDSKLKTVVDKDIIKKGDEIELILRKNTPMTMSLPGQLTPAAVVIKTDNSFIKADKFDSEFLSYDKNLKLNIGEKTIIKDYKGEKLEKEDIVEKDVIVIYGPTTFSIPPQTVGEINIIKLKEKVIEEKEITNLSKVVIKEKEITLSKEIFLEDEEYMIPLRQITEELGYELTWNNKDRSVELIKGPLYHLVKIGSNDYNFAKMIVKLDKAPVLKSSNTFVPMNFLNEGLKLENVKIIDGILNISEK